MASLPDQQANVCCSCSSSALPASQCVTFLSCATVVCSASTPNMAVRASLGVPSGLSLPCKATDTHLKLHSQYSDSSDAFSHKATVQTPEYHGSIRLQLHPVCLHALTVPLAQVSGCAAFQCLQANPGLAARANQHRCMDQKSTPPWNDPVTPLAHAST